MDPDRGITLSMRSKEEAHDYRYFPDPDLLPLDIAPEWIEAVRQSLPELPEERRARFIADYELPEYDAGVLTSSRELADFFEDCLKLLNSPKSVGNWIMGPLLGLLNAQDQSIEDSPVTPKNLAGLLQLIDKGTISEK